METKERFHFIGIGGIGMSGLAHILLKKKIPVTGSDIAFSYVTDSLSKAGAQIFLGHASHQVPSQATVVYSTDIKKDNPEYQAARDQNCKLLHRSDLLLHLMKGYKTLAIAGTHGKTTSSALLSWVLHQAGNNPSFVVGGMIPQFLSNAGHGTGDYFVAEADESDGTFLKYPSFGGIVTNIDRDHVNHYGDMNNLVKAFNQFIHQMQQPEFLFWCGDNTYLKNMQLPGNSYGFGSDCKLRIVDFNQKGWGITFSLNFKGKQYSNVQLPLVGRHQALNGAAVFGLALSLGIDEDQIRNAFLSFGGVMRRCEKKGEVQNVLLLDDYAHHPTEIKTTLQGIRQAIGGRRLIALFQPHRYSRVKECQGLYKGIFAEADEVYVTEIFGAGEVPIEGISSRDLIQEIDSDRMKKCHYVPREKLANTLSTVITTHDVLVSLGAGDITKISQELLRKFEQTPPKKLHVGILFGGRSTEHQVSLMSAKYICECISKEYYSIQHFGITKQGHWIAGDDSMEQLENPLEGSATKKSSTLLSLSVLNEIFRCDLFIPVFHGPYGEDGTIQGFFETIDKAFVGTDHTSASICMDKALTKHIMLAHNIPTLPFIEINHQQWKNNSHHFINRVKESFPFPVYVKPVHLGSTVGVQKVDDFMHLESAVEKAFQYDYKLIVEPGIVNVREIEFAVLGNEEALVFPPGEVPARGNFYDFDNKYGPEGVKALPKANLNDDITREGMELALKAYQVVGCTGMARVDFFLDSKNKLWLNEINPIPGFTQQSIYPKICELNGIDGEELIDRLIILALERKRRNQVLARER